MITVFGGTKGGAGKTTAAMNVAVGLAREGGSVVLVDVDKQRSLSKWHSRRIDGNHGPAMTLVEKQGNVHAVIRDLSSHYDHVIVDAAGDDNQEMRTAMTCADILIVVIRPSQFDAETLEEFTEVIETAKDFNPELKARILVNQAPTLYSETETDDVSEFVTDFPQAPQLSTVMHSRKAYRDALAPGLSVLELNTRSAKKAQQEVRQLIKEVY